MVLMAGKRGLDLDAAQRQRNEAEVLERLAREIEEAKRKERGG
jgi:hypothetical protein